MDYIEKQLRELLKSEGGLTEEASVEYLIKLGNELVQSIKREIYNADIPIKIKEILITHLAGKHLVKSKRLEIYFKESPLLYKQSMYAEIKSKHFDYESKYPEKNKTAYLPLLYNEDHEWNSKKTFFNFSNPKGAFYRKRFTLPYANFVKGGQHFIEKGVAVFKQKYPDATVIIKKDG